MARAGALERKGIELCLKGLLPEGLATLRCALQLTPACASIRGNLAVACALAGRWQEAETHFRAVLETAPDDADQAAGLAWCLHELGRFDEALAAHRHAVRLDPDSGSAHRNFGRTLAALDRFDEAERAFRQSIRLEPDDARAWAGLARLYHRLRRHHEALECRARILELQPADGLALAGLASAQFNVGALPEAVAGFRKAAGQTDAWQVKSEYLFALLHDHRPSPARLRSEHARFWGRRRPAATAPSGDVGKRLRIGYLTGEFYRCPGYYFLYPLLSHHDRSNFDVFFYYTGRANDEYTREFEEVATQWRSVGLLGPAEIAALIRSDQIDILVDLSGHFTSGRFEVFEHCAAPVQVNYPNYPSTLGIPQMDYLISDAWTAVAETCSEQVVRLASGFLVWQPPASPRVTALPARRNGYVTFGLFQRPAKMNAPVWDCVAAILRAVPRSKLLVHHATRDYADAKKAARARVEDALRRRGVPAERLEFEPGCAMGDHLKVLTRADIALDTFPYNGQTTTCECLWMGVPVVTLAGERLASRIGRGILMRLGVPDWVAGGPDEYVTIARGLAGDLDGLAGVRASLRGRMRASTLLRPDIVTRELEAAYREMWRRRIL